MIWREIQGVSVKRFFLSSIFFLPPCFMIWHLLSPWNAIAIGWIVEKILIIWSPELFSSVEVKKTIIFVIMTTSESKLTFSVEPRLITYSLPFFTALHFALPFGSFNHRFIFGLLFLWVLSIFGTLAICLKESLLLLGPGFFEEMLALSSDFIPITYQFSVLLMPTLAPVTMAGVILTISRENAVV